jgi:glycerol uptake operon antiterminator
LYIIKSDIFIDLLKENPVIAAVKDEEGLIKSLESDCAAVFILYGDLLSIGSIVSRIKSAAKLAIVHLD